MLIAATAFALTLANSSLADAYLGLWQTKLTLALGGFEMSHSLKHWVSDGLMAIFFFVVGLEVKREVVSGQLGDLRAASLPIAGALGGMVVPAAIYVAFLWGEPAAQGWGIPMATDIAFVVGCMAVLGRRIPPGLRVLLLSIAIADDIGAVLVIAIGYTDSIATGWLLLGIAGIGAVWIMGKIGVRSVAVYLVVGGFVWLGFHESGVHATIAGVILGLMTPADSWVSDHRLRRIARRANEFLHGESWGSTQRAALRELEIASRERVSPLERIENALHPWQSFAIVPLFALANAGVPIEANAVADPVAVAVAAGLVLGKPLGIVGAAWLAVRSGLARLPEGVSWRAVVGGGLLAGIGFTMSLFIANLALADDSLLAAKVGILVGSAIAAALGMAILVRLPVSGADPG